MTAFPEWLGQVGLAHCRPILQAHGIDFDSAAHLSEDDLRRLGLDQGDSQRLLQAIASRGHDHRRTASGASSSPSCSAIWWVTPVCLSASIPRNLRDLRQAFVEACTEGVRRYDGHVAQILGDGLMVYFGWPGRTRTMPSAACARPWRSWRPSSGVSAIEPLAVHIGIATGEVVVGGRRAGIGEVGLAVGETPKPGGTTAEDRRSRRDRHRARHPAPRG